MKENEGRKMELLKANVKKHNTFIMLILLIIISSILSPQFLTTTNLLNVMRQATLFGIIALGMTLIIISGGIDLSVGSMVAVASVLSATLIQSHGMFVALALPLLVTTVLGCVNGLIITKGNLQPFLVTLATMTIARGFSQIYAHGMLIEIFEDKFLYLGRNYFLGIPIPVIIWVILFGIMYFIMKCTVLGISVYSIGGNETASFLSGLPVNKVKIGLYTLSGFLSGLAGLIYTSRLGAGYGMAGMYYEMDAISAVVLGGTLMSGGVGTVTGTFWGVLIISVIKNILNMLNVPSAYHLVVTAAIIVGAVITQKRH